jgi:ABC-type phosphate transport system permease subunit
MKFDFDAEFASHKRKMKIFGAAFAVVWVLIFLMVIGIFSFIGYAAYQGISNPEVIGNFAGEIVKGYEDKVNE